MYSLRPPFHLTALPNPLAIKQCVHFVTVSRDLHGFDAPCTEVARVHGKCTGNEKFEHLMHGFAKFKRFLPFQRDF